MKKKFHLFWLFFLLVAPGISVGQNQHRIDSLTTSLAKAADDKTKCAILSALFDEYIRTNVDKAAFYNDQCLHLAEKNGYQKTISEAIYKKSSVFRLKGKYDSALAVLVNAKSIFKELPDSIAFADYLSDVGFLYSLKSDHKNALISLLGSLEIPKFK